MNFIILLIYLCHQKSWNSIASEWIDWKYEMLALYILCENISDSKMIFVQLKCIWNTSFNNEFIQLQSEHKWQGWQRLLIINYRLCDSEILRGVNKILQ